MVTKRYADTPTESIAREIGRTASSVYQHAHKLGLRKSQEYLSTEAAGRLRGGKGAAYRFKPGNPAWNKGMKGLDIGGKATRFKKGNKPHTWRPVGSERIDREGYLVRKISDTGVKNDDWVELHTYVWTQNNGPVPEGHVVIFKDGNKRDFSLANLECISRGELMLRNSVHRLPKEIAELVQLRGALNRQINKRSGK